MSRSADIERMNVSERLKDALAAAKLPTTVAAFVKEFNLRADGAMVTVHAARKWFNGDAIPTQDRIHILANWIGVSAQWLRYGEENDGPADEGHHLETRDIELANDIRQLPEEARQLIRVMVTLLLKSQRDGQ